MTYDEWVSTQRAEREAAYKAEKQAEREHRQFVRQADREKLPFVYCQFARCDRCGGTDHRLYRSAGEADGSRLKWAECRTCGHKFIQVWE